MGEELLVTIAEVGEEMEQTKQLDPSLVNKARNKLKKLGLPEEKIEAVLALEVRKYE